MKNEVKSISEVLNRLTISVVLFFQLNHTVAQGSTENVDLTAPWLNAELYSVEEIGRAHV